MKLFASQTGTHTIPEASMAGQTEEAVKESGVPYIVGKASYSDNPRGRMTSDQDGLFKLTFRRDDMRLLRVHVVGEQATERVHIGLMALECGGDIELLNRVYFNYPTLGDLYKTAGYDAMMTKIKSSPTATTP